MVDNYNALPNMTVDISFTQILCDDYLRNFITRNICFRTIKMLKQDLAEIYVRVN